MAGFSTHVSVAAVVSSFTVVCASTLNVLSVYELFSLFLLGVLSTSIPDLDSDTSKPLKITYSILSLFIPSVLTLLLYSNYFSFIQISGAKEIVISFLSLYFIFALLFFFSMKFTKHRGVFHSIPMALFSGSLAMLIFNKFLPSDVFVVFIGVFIALGVLTHLILDEVYSIVKFKKSLGSAFKLYDKNNKLGTLLLYSFSLFTAYLFSNNILLFVDIVQKS